MIETLVAFCVRRPWAVVILAALITASALFVTVTRFAINTDTARLIAPEVEWRKNEIAFDEAFPHRMNLIVAVIDGETPEIADEAAEKLTRELEGRPDLFTSVGRPDAGPFFARNGLLFLPLDELTRTTAQLGEQKDLLEILAADPSLRGAVNMLGTALMGVQFAGVRLDDLARPYNDFAAAWEKALAGERARLSWQRLFARGEPNPSDTRKLVIVKPVLDFSALQPGIVATDTLRTLASQQGLTAENGVRLRLTGQVPLADEEFVTVAENLWLNIGGTIAAVTLILFAALRYARTIVAVLATLFVGLIVTSGLGLLVVGELNLISIAFAVLFIGLGVDFGIQYAVRYRMERHTDSDLRVAVRRAGKSAGGPITLAALSLAIGFLCFLPTEFRGVSELGLIAGLGMGVAYLATLTVLPALLTLLRPPAEEKTVQTSRLASVDHWIAAHRRLVLGGTALIVLAGTPFLFDLTFDSNPMNLRSPAIESVSTYHDLTRNPDTSPNTIEIVTPSVDAAVALAPKVAALPEVARVVTLQTFIPDDQDRKRQVIAKAAADLAGVFAPPQPSAPPTEAETIQALKDVAEELRAVKGPADSPGVRAANRLAAAMERLAEAPADRRKAAESAVLVDFRRLVDQLRTVTNPERVTRESLPKALVEEWVSPDGRSRAAVFPKGDSNDAATIRRFVASVRAVAPDATGAPVSISESGHTVVRAFVQAGIFAFIAITLILWVALKRLKDVLLTLGPLILAGVLTLQAAYLIGLPLNFANIIALPLMFGVGVAFHIYYVIAWRAGVADMLASSLTRAIFFSALTTGTAFGSLWLSSHPGTASMGELLAISLVFTLLAAFIIVPAFLGPPPAEGERSGSTFGH